MSGKIYEKGTVSFPEPQYESSDCRPWDAGSGTLYTTGDVEDVFRCVSRLCAGGQLYSPQKSSPPYRRAPPSIRIAGDIFDGGGIEKQGFSFRLPPDLRALYSAAPLAYYLGASVDIDNSAHIALNSGGRIAIPDHPDFEAWTGEMLRRTFYLDCAVRYAYASGGLLNGLDVKELLGLSAHEIFHMMPDERFLLYADPSLDIPELPVWHMAAYLDPVPENVEVLPFLLHSLSAIYVPRSIPTTERGIVSMSIRSFLGRQKEPDAGINAASHSIVVPALRKARSQLWFSEGYPVDAVKASAQAFVNGRRYRKKANVRVGVICNEEAMAEEVDVIIEALSNTHASLEIRWDAGVAAVTGAFARGFDILQLIGHCDGRGFKCSDGFARVSDIPENNTPMFFFNSCASHREAEKLIAKGSVCGVATLFRVLEEAAFDVCRNFYRMLGAGYPAFIALDAARECSVLGKEYLLIGDGSFTCFNSDGLKPFYRIDRLGDEWTLGLILGNVDKGYVIGSWTSTGKRMVSDLGSETRFLSAEHLASMAEKFEGFCLYERNIYASVEEAALKAAEDARGGPGPSRYRRGKIRRSHG